MKEHPLACSNGRFGSGPLASQFDATDQAGAGRVEDTYNLVGHALKTVMSVVAGQQRRDLAEVAKEAGAEVLGGSSLKAALDRDWDQQKQKEEPDCANGSQLSTPLPMSVDGKGDALAIDRHGQESLRSVPLRCRSQFICPGSFPAAFD